MLREFRIYSFLIVFYSVSTLVLTHPMVGKWGNHLFGDGDCYFSAWVVRWVYHGLNRSPLQLFHANIFYPAPNSLAFSEHFLSAQLLFAPIYFVSQNPVLAYNLVLLLSFVLCGLTMFALVRELTNDRVAAFVSGFAFAFSPIRFLHYPHLQILLIWWSPLALLFLERYLTRPSWSDCMLFSVMFWLQFLASTYLGLYLATMALFRLLYAACQHKELFWNRQSLGKLAFFGAGSTVVLSPFVLPYLQVSRQWRYTRTLEENIGSSAELTSYISPVPGNYLYGKLLTGFAYVAWPKYLFIGFLPIMLALLGAWIAFSRSNGGASKSEATVGRAYAILGLIALILSLGPFLTWHGNVTQIPLPYLLFYYFLPGYQAMRIPARFCLWVGLTLSVLAGIALRWLFARLGKRFADRRFYSFVQGGIGIAVILGLALESYTPIPPLPVDVNANLPGVYHYLATEEDRSPLIELPMPKKSWREEVPWQEAKRTYLSIYHRRPMVNGYSGFAPPSFEEIRKLANEGPRSHVIEGLAALGITTIILHLDEMSEPERLAWQEMDPKALGLAEVARFGPDRVLKIMAEPAR